MQTTPEQRAEEVLRGLASNPRLSRFIDPTRNIPRVHHGSGEIKLIILGQDPTIKNASSRWTVKTVLNLDKRGSLRNYLSQICSYLGLDLEQNVYATNYFKNFFIKPPTQIAEIDVFQEFSSIWLPLLQDELSAFPQAPVISLGQPLLSVLVREGVSPHVRDYWGYVANWKLGGRVPFRCLELKENQLDRVVFPFPHQPSLRKQFYNERMRDYTAFVRRNMDTSGCRSGI